MGELRERGTTFLVVSHNMHTVAGFVDWVALLHDGKMTRFDDVFEGVREYARCFRDEDAETVEELVAEGKHIRFEDVKLDERVLRPGGEFSFSMRYDCTRAYRDVEVDIAVYTSRDPDLYFQATNRAYKRTIDFPEGQGTFTVTLKDLRIQNSLGRIVLAIWDKNRTEQLFWWRVPVEFEGVDHATGKNFLPVEFEVVDQRPLELAQPKRRPS